MPEIEVPHQVPVQPIIDTTRLTSLLLASTLMQTMKARTEETQQEDSAFRALQAVASTNSDNYKDDTAYDRYKAQHDDVPEREREFLKTLINFQTQSLQIFERKQSQIQQLEAQVRSQKDLTLALEKSLQSEAALRQQLQDTEHQWQQANAEYQAQQQRSEAEIQRLREENDRLVKEKNRITQEHIQESYLTNLNLHRRTVDLEQEL